MQVTVNKEINYVEEANSLLYNYVNSKTYEKMKQEGIRKVAYSSDIYNERFQHIININNYVTENMRFEKSQLEYYFKEIGNSDMSLSNYLFLFYTDVQYLTVVEYVEASKRKKQDEIIKEFDYLISQYYSFGKSGEQKAAESFEEMIRAMDKADFTAEDKWKIVQAYIEHEKHIGELSVILEKTVQLLKECREEVNILEKEFYEYWVDYTKRNNFLERLQNLANISWQYSEKENILIPAIFRPNNLTISITDEDEKKIDIIHLGVILDENLSYKVAKIDSEDLNNALKILSDKSKFEILKYIKDKPAYGFEIANTLNLTTSTISYHMSGLISARLVKIEKDTNKIYYSLNKETVESILEDIGKMLL